MRVLRKRYWLALIFGAAVTLATGTIEGAELDGAPVSIRTWGRPLPWLKRTGPTHFDPSRPVVWSFGIFGAVFFSLDTLFWSLPMLLVLRSRHRRALPMIATRKAAGLCTWCGYDLRGLAGPTCPECGEEFSAKQSSAAE